MSNINHATFNKVTVGYIKETCLLIGYITGTDRSKRLGHQSVQTYLKGREARPDKHNM